MPKTGKRQQIIVGIPFFTLPAIKSIRNQRSSAYQQIRQQGFTQQAGKGRGF